MHHCLSNGAQQHFPILPTRKKQCTFCYDLFSRIITPEQGKILADTWKAVFVESSAKENKVSDIDLRYLLVLRISAVGGPKFDCVCELKFHFLNTNSHFNAHTV